MIGQRCSCSSSFNRFGTGNVLKRHLEFDMIWRVKVRISLRLFETNIARPLFTHSCYDSQIHEGHKLFFQLAHIFSHFSPFYWTWRHDLFEEYSSKRLAREKAHRPIVYYASLLVISSLVFQKVMFKNAVLFAAIQSIERKSAPI